jgi:pimeloyl-ACP methyl ester carboxylesterase
LNGNDAMRARVDFVAKHFQSATPRRGERYAGGRGESSAPVEIVSGRWLVKAILAAVVVAGLALYGTICLLFYQGQWQFVFLPVPGGAADSVSSSWTRRTAPQPAMTGVDSAARARSAGLPVESVLFDYTEEGVARLHGWWIAAAKDTAPNEAKKHQEDAPAANPAALSSLTVLFCPDGRSRMAGSVRALEALHALDINVFAFDYRGTDSTGTQDQTKGTRAKEHPSQAKAYADGVAALDYLVTMRHLPAQHVVIYGVGAGAAVAAQIAAARPQIAGLVMEDPQPSLATEVRREQKIRLLPMWLVFSDRFDITETLPQLQMPKLILSTQIQPEYTTGASAVARMAAAPKQMVRLDAVTPAALYAEPAWRNAMRNFLSAAATRSH